MNWNDLSNTLKTIFIVITGLSSTAGFIAIAVYQYKKITVRERMADTTTSDMVVEHWKKEVDNITAVCKDLQAQLQHMKSDMDVMKGQLAEKTHQNEQYIALLQNRNPELETFMKNMTIAVTDFQAYIKKNDERMEKVLSAVVKN